MTTRIKSESDIALSPSGLENAVIVETDGDLQLKKDARLPNNQSLIWRNAANSADLPLVADTSNNLKYNSLTLVSASLGLIPLASIENGGGGGGSGFTLQLVSTGFTAATNTQYLVDTSSAAFTATLPTGTAQYAIRFSDDQRTWGINNLTIQPASGQRLDGFAIDEPLICDLTGATVQVSWDGTKWVIDSNVVMGASSSTLSGSGSGSGEKNYVTRPDNANADWISSNVSLVTVATESVSSNLPESATKTTAIRVTRVSGTTGYVRYRFVADPADLGKKFKIQWNHKYAGTAGDYTIEMWSFTASDYTTGPLQHPIQSSSIPAITNSGTFATTFDTGATTQKYLELRIVAVAGTTPIYISGVVIGPGVVVQGAAISEWQSFTPSWDNLSVGNGTTTGKWRRVGSSIDVVAEITFGTTTSVSGQIRHILPSSLTPVAPTANVAVGSAFFFDASAPLQYVGNVTQTTSPNVIFAPHGATTSANATVPFTWTTSDILRVEYVIPIAEWAGNGTVSLGPGSQIEYASSTTGTWDAAAAAVNTVYGPAGSPITGALTANRNKIVRFQYPIQNDDQFVLEFLPTSHTAWLEQATWAPLIIGGSLNFGAQIIAVSGTDVTVGFYQYRGQGPTFNSGTGAANWATTDGFWRLRKSKASSPVGFGLADSTSSGLISNTAQTIAGAKTFSSEVILGPTGSASSSLFHRINIPSVTSYNYSVSQTYGLLGAFTTNSGLGLLGNAHNTDSTGLALDAAVHDTNSAQDMIFRVRENDNTDFATTNTTAFSWRRFATEIGKVTRAGEWSFGPTGSSAVHIFRGTEVDFIGPDTTSYVSLYLQNSTNSQSSFITQDSSTGGAYISGAAAYSLNISSLSGLSFSGNNSTLHGSLSTTGTWTLGPSSSNTISHVVNGALANGTVMPSFNSSGSRYYGNKFTNLTNTLAAGNGANIQLWAGAYNPNNASTFRSIANQSAANFALSSRNANGNAFAFSVDASFSHAADSAASFVSIGAADFLGAWTFGPSAGGVNHTINGNLVYSNTLFSIIANTTDASDTKSVGINGGGALSTGRGGMLLIYGNEAGSSNGGTIQIQSGNSADASNTNRGIQFYGAAATGGAVTLNGSMTGAGAWTFGASGGSLTHNFNGAIVATGEITAFSDQRLKENIAPIQNALSLVKDIRGVSFTKDGLRSVGFVAQELREIIPEVVRENQNGYLSVAYGNITALLVEAVKELSTKLDKLQEKLNAN